MGTYWADKQTAQALYQRNRDKAERQMKVNSADRKDPVVTGTQMAGIGNQV